MPSNRNPQAKRTATGARPGSLEDRLQKDLRLWLMKEAAKMGRAMGCKLGADLFTPYLIASIINGAMMGIAESASQAKLSVRVRGGAR